MRQIFSATGRTARRHAALIGLGTVATFGLVAASVVPATAAGTVTSADIKNQTIRSWDISRGGVAGSEVRNQSLHSWDIARGGVGTSEIRNGSVHEDDLNEEVSSQLGKGEKGDPGQNGQDGQDGVSGYEVVTNKLDFGPGGIGGAACPAGKVAVGGGASLTTDDVNNGVAVIASWPYTADSDNPDDRNGWKVQVNKPAGVDPGDVTVYAVCMIAS